MEVERDTLQFVSRVMREQAAKLAGTAPELADYLDATAGDITAYVAEASEEDDDEERLAA